VQNNTLTYTEFENRVIVFVMDWKNKALALLFPKSTFSNLFGPGLQEERKPGSAAAPRCGISQV